MLTLKSLATALPIVVALCATAAAQPFTPTVTTTFDTLDTGTASGFTQEFTFFEGQEGPLMLDTTFDRGGFDFSGIQVGDTIGMLSSDIFVDNPFPIPDISGTIEAEVQVTSIMGSTVEAEAVVTFVSPALVSLILLSGFPDPTGLTGFIATYEDLPGDSGATIMVMEAGGLPISAGTLIFDLPITWETNAFYVHSPVDGTLAVDTEMVSFSGTPVTINESFDLNDVGGVPIFLRGDFSGDGAVLINDPIGLLGFLFQGEAGPICADAADADDSEILGIGDAINVLNFLFVGAAAPPAPGPVTCGPDPSGSALDCAVQPACP